jgi:hypothetical protein
MGIAGIAGMQIYSRKCGCVIAASESAIENDRAKIASKQIFHRGEYFRLTQE